MHGPHNHTSSCYLHMYMYMYIEGTISNIYLFNEVPLIDTYSWHLNSIARLETKVFITKKNFCLEIKAFDNDIQFIHKLGVQENKHENMYILF